MTVPIELSNPFKGDCRFQISTRQERLEQSAMEQALQAAGLDTERTRASTAADGGEGKKKGKGKKQAAPTVFPPDESILNFFHIKESEVAVKQGQASTVN